jgi:hypothetical protein
MEIMRIVKALILSVAIGFSHNASAEINFGYSMEWVCSDADYIVTGKLIQADSCFAQTKGKSGKDLIKCAVVVDSWIKADQIAKEKNYVHWWPMRDTIYFAVRCDRNKLMQQFLKDQSELLVFLNQGIQGFNYKGHGYDIYLIDYSFVDRPYIFDFNRLPNLFFDATNQKVLTTKKGIIDKCRAVVAQFNAFRQKHPNKEIEMKKIEATGDVANALWEGSASYLYVPDYLFPKAKGPRDW